MPNVDITQSGRGGTIYYREGGDVALFDWEFAGGDALAIVYGRNAAQWDRAYPWAAGRQQEVYDTLGAEVVRQQTNGGTYTVDLHNGWVTIYSAPPRGGRGARRETERATQPPKTSPAFQRFERSVPPPHASRWEGDATYDVSGVAEMTTAEREAGVSLLLSRGPSWREVEALAAFDTPLARLHVLEALDERLSVATRLAAAEAAHRWDPSFALGERIARELKALHRADDGLAHALRLAESHDAPEVRRALLYASWNRTECSSACAALLLRLAGADASGDVAERLGMHESHFTRKAAFDELCARAGMAESDLYDG